MRCTHRRSQLLVELEGAPEQVVRFFVIPPLEGREGEVVQANRDALAVPQSLADRETLLQ